MVNEGGTAPNALSTSTLSAPEAGIVVLNQTSVPTKDPHVGSGAIVFPSDVAFSFEYRRSEHSLPTVSTIALAQLSLGWPYPVTSPPPNKTRREIQNFIFT
jgi:hypothetical protein